MTAINEAGTYRLIFTSRKDEAEQFKRWLTQDVLPEPAAQIVIVGISPPECPSTGYW